MNEKLITFIVNENEIITVEKRDEFFYVFKNQEYFIHMRINPVGVYNLTHILQIALFQFVPVDEDDD